LAGLVDVSPGQLFELADAHSSCVGHEGREPVARGKEAHNGFDMFSGRRLHMPLLGDRGNAQDALADTEDVFAQIGWGLNLALLASIGLALSGLALVLGARRVQRPAHLEAPEEDTSAPFMGQSSQSMNAASAVPEAMTSPKSPAAELERLTKLHAQGALSDEEFTQAKARVLRD
jgi:Short C-terminal domain